MMFGLGIKDLIVFAAGAFIASAAIVTGYEKLIVPEREARVEERVEADVAERIAAASELAAAQARAAERARQKAAADAALAAYEESVQAREAEAQARLADLERENREYAETLRQLGKSCPLDQGISDFITGGGDLGGLRPAASPGGN